MQCIEKRIDFVIPGKTVATDNSLLNQQSWLLKCVSIELRTLAVNKQRSHTQRLITLLLDDNPNPAHKSEYDAAWFYLC